MRICDITIVSMKPDPVFRVYLPMKALDSLFLGIPILYGGSGEVHDIISACGAGSVFLSQLYVNTSACPKCIGSRKFANNDQGNMLGHSVLTIADGDIVFLALQSDGTNDILNAYGNLTIHRL